MQTRGEGTVVQKCVFEIGDRQRMHWHAGIGLKESAIALREGFIHVLAQNGGLGRIGDQHGQAGKRQRFIGNH